MSLQEEIEKLIHEGQSYTFANNSETSRLGTYSKASTDFLAWIAIVEDFIINHYSKNSAPYSLFKEAETKYFTGYEDWQFAAPHSKIIGALKACFRIPVPELQPTSSLGNLSVLMNRFHQVVRQLRFRYNSRPTLDIKDEYDVQDLLHALLRLYFDDIRDEEWTPSYAGGSARMDFLLKDIQTVVEVKMTRNGLNDKQLGNQLIEDKAKYKVHPDCKYLVCFVYDPDGRIKNPRGIEADLNETDIEFRVSIIIKPE
jgi:hypothetical protein